MRFKLESICFSLLALFFAMFMRMDFARAQIEGQNMVVIANENSPLPLEMSRSEIKDLYLGVKEKEKGVKLLLTDQKDKKIFGEFLSQLVGMSVASYKSHWVKKLFSAGSEYPKVIDGPIEMIKYVSENAGAIGYVWKGDIKGNERGIRVVKILP